jgi:biopolymer transport protein ExbD/biopolymer transport protein TolR
MASTTSEGDELKSDINVTPLVDVMLVLLVIFMVVTPLLKQQVPVELPLAEHSHEAQETSQVTLAAFADGTLFLNEQLIAAEALDGALHNLYAERFDKTIFLEADRSLPYSRVVDLMDACRAAGVERIGVVTKKPAPAS